MTDKDSPVCPVCMSWCEEKDGWIRCMSCQYGKKITKRIITPVGDHMGPGTGTVDDFNNY